MTTTPHNMSSVHHIHHSGNPPTVTPSTAPKTSSNDSKVSGGNYPEQMHAGAVGYGPNYHAGPTLVDKVGLKEELRGKLTGNPDLVQHGREVRSGEDRRTKLTVEDEPNPFSTPDEDGDTQESARTMPSTVPPRHQGHPMRPTGGAEHHSMHHPDSSCSSQSQQSHDAATTDANAGTDNNNNTDASAPGFNLPIGLRDGKIQTIVGTPDLTPTTASQQPAFHSGHQPYTPSHPSSHDTDSQSQCQGSAEPDTTPQSLAGPQDSPFVQDLDGRNSPNSPACFAGMRHREGYGDDAHLDSPFLQQGGPSPSSPAVNNIPGGVSGNENKLYVTQTQRRGDEKLSNEPYNKTTIGQGGDAILSVSGDQVRNDDNLMGLKAQEKERSVKFDDIAGQETGAKGLPPTPKPCQ